MDPALRELVAEGDPLEEVEAILRLEPGTHKVPAPAREITRFADIATVRLRRGEIEQIWSDPATQSLKAPRTLEFDQPDETQHLPQTAEGLTDLFDTQSARVPLAAHGAGVVVGVIDWGFDFTHPAFLDASGRSRIKALWDQRGGGAPAPYGYGRVHRRADIDAALNQDTPFDALGYHPGASDRGHGAHGTHVADIAAGSRRAEGGGVAPEAELVFVHLSSAPLTGLATLGDSVRLLEALDFIAAQAGDRPVVINMSIGRHGGPHTGLTLVEQAFDRFLEAAPDRLIVQSAGNYYMANAHQSGRLAPGQKTEFSWQTKAGDRTANELEIWYSDRDKFDLEVVPPGASSPIHVALGEARGLYDKKGEEVARLYHRAYDPNSPDHQAVLFLRPNAPAGNWKIKLTGALVEDGRWHAWVERDSSLPRNQSKLARSEVDRTSTIGSICNGFLPIAVGAAQSDAPNSKPAPFASSGPTRDGRQKPDLAAPGLRIRAARSTPRWSRRARPGTTSMSGASQAAPHVCGVAAAMLGAMPRGQSIHQIRSALFQLMDPISGQDPAAMKRLGAGLISSRNIAAKLKAHAAQFNAKET